jgi:hypothetical protein
MLIMRFALLTTILLILNIHALRAQDAITLLLTTGLPPCDRAEVELPGDEKSKKVLSQQATDQLSGIWRKMVFGNAQTNNHSGQYIVRFFNRTTLISEFSVDFENQNISFQRTIKIPGASPPSMLTFASRIAAGRDLSIFLHNLYAVTPSQ